MKNALATAHEYLDVRESGGKNRSPEIDSFNRFVRSPLGSPYCAAAISWCFDQAGCQNFPFSASSQEIMRWFRRHSFLTTDPQKMLDFSGALFGWTNPDGAHGHLGIVSKRLTIPNDNCRKSYKVIAIETIEFNTTPKTGERDGEGCFALKRSVPVDRGHQLWFLDTSSLVGGSWW